MMTLFGGSIFLFGKDTVSKVLEIPMAENFLLPVVAAVISFCVVMTCTTSPSISLEGRNLGILKSLPLEPMTIFLGKVGVNLILLLPAVVLNVGLLSAGLGFDGLEAILFLCVEVLYSLMIAIAGILVNLYLPKLEWTAQVAVVKQSASVLVAMLIGFGSIVTPILLYTFLKPGSNLLFMAGLATGLLLLVAILWQLLKNRGVRQFESL